jgi:hypothetical protein
MADSMLEGVSQELVLFNQNLPALMDAQFETIEGTFESLEEVNGNAMDLMSQTLLRIEGILLTFLDVIPATIEIASQNQIATALDLSDADLDAEALAAKKNKRNKEPEDDKKGGKFLSEFNKGKEGAGEGGVEGLLDSFLPISALMGGLGAAFGTMTAVIIPLIPVILGVAAAIGAVVYGLMQAFSYFNANEGSFGDKLLAGIEGFFQGMLKVVTLPFDFLKDGLSWLATAILGEGNFISDFLDSFTIFDSLSAILSDYFSLIGDIIDIFVDIGETVGGYVMKVWEDFEPARKGMAAMFDGIGAFIDWIIDIGATAAKFLGISFPESTEPEAPAIELDQKQQNAAEKGAKDSGLYEKNIIGKSVVDEGMLAGASAEQLQAIVNDEDISDDQMKLVKNMLKQMTSAPSGGDSLLAAIKQVSPEMTPDEAAKAKVNAAASKAKSDAHLASVPPEELAAIQAEMGLGTSGVEVVETDQHKLNQFAAQQRESHRRINEKYAAPTPKLKTAPPKATVATAIERDPVTGMPLAGSFKAPAGSEGSVFTVLDPVSGEVQTFDDFERASMFAAANEMDVKTVPKASVAGAGSSLAASDQMQQSTTKMNDGKSDLAGAGGGAAVAVNAPTNTTNVSNTTHRGAMPNAMDASDRTDRRRRG